MKILSLFDGMACGMIAMQNAGITVDRYIAYEIDKYAIQTSTHNFPMIEQRGDVFEADFTEYSDFDFLIGGSPCTYWSIAQKNNRETVASGMGWELFSQYVRALHEVKPKWFIYENNKSMSKAIRASIDEAFGFGAVEINSKLVSAQNRQRLYWVGRRNEDGTYSKVNVEQPKDRGILLKDVLESGTIDKEKAYCLKHQAGNARDYFKKHHTQIALEPVAINTTVEGDKARTLMAGYYKYGTATLITNEGFTGGTTAVAEPIRVGSLPRPNGELSGSQAKRIYSVDGKSVNLVANGGGEGAKTGLYAIPCCNMSIRVGDLPNGDGKVTGSQGRRIYSTDGKSVCIAAGASGGNTDNNSSSTGLYAIPCCNMPVKEATKQGYTEIEPMDCVDMTQPNSKTRRGRNMADKSNCCMTSCQYYQYCGVLAYATPCEWDENGKVTKAISAADGKTYTVYEVKDGQITIKDKQYPIKLVDGFYIIRKLTVRECMRLQTVPEWYEFPVSDTRAYQLLGNGWTVAVIEALINATQEGNK